MKSVKNVFTNIIVFLLVFLATGMLAGCGSDNPNLHEVGDKWDVAIKEDVTYSFEVLSITEEDFTVRIENKNPEINDYLLSISGDYTIDCITANGVELDKGYGAIIEAGDIEVNQPYYEHNFYVPFIESSVELCVKYKSGDSKFKVIDKVNAEAGLALETNNKNVYAISFTMHFKK